jgi:CheY-like chemotaxis protein
MEKTLKGKRILVVEDEETNWFLIRDILESFQVLTTWADLGQKAIDMIKEGENFDVILMDIHLPSIDGLKVTTIIKSLRKDIPIIAQTAFALDTEIKNCYKAGCIAHICKPYTINELTSVISKVLEED